MTEQLHQRLADLAGDVASPGPADPAVLWRAGRQRQRRRTAAAGLAACAVLLAGVSGAGLLLPSTDLATAPSATTAKPALPDRLYAPSRWLESNDDDPVGPFAALGSAGRGWSGDYAYVGISAVSSDYRFLDLPAAVGAGAGEHDPVLSPSGRFVAYWLGGRTEERPAEIIEGEDPIVGIGVYDTVTGEAVRSIVRTEHGLAPGQLVWVSQDRVYFQASELAADATPTSYEARALGAGWTVRLGDSIEHPRELGEEPVVLPPGRGSGHALVSDRRGRLLLDTWAVDEREAEEGSQLVLVDFDRGGSRRFEVTAGVQLSGVSALRPDGALAGLEDDDGVHTIPAPVVVSKRGERTVVPGVDAYGVEGWAGPRLVVYRVVEDLEQDAGGSTTLSAVDPKTGAAEVLVRMPAGPGHMNVHGYASDLFAVPAVRRAAPEAPVDPRLLLTGAGVLLVAAVVVLRLWRRRAQH